MSGGGTPKDNSVQLEQMRQRAAADAQAATDRKAAQELEQWRGSKTSAMEGARSAAARYFTDQGVDPTPYMSAINDMINEKANSLSNLAPIGNTFQDLGQSAYQNAQTSERLKANKSLDPIFPSGFDYTKIPDTLDDATLAAVDAEQRNTAEQFVNAMKARGIITDTGYGAAEAALDKQAPGVMARLTEQGNLALEGGRQDIRGVRGRAASSADALNVGQSFNAPQWQTQLDTAFNNFLTGLGSNVRGRVGNANLYDTSGLATIAGAAQGAGPGVQPSSTGLPFSSSEDEDKKLASRTGSSTGVLGASF